MSSSTLAEWAQSQITKLFETQSEDNTGVQEAHFTTTFSPTAHITMNHESISLADFQKRISELGAHGLVKSGSVEWKNVLEDRETGIFAGFFVLTRSMAFKIRAGPAQNHTFVTVSARIEQDGDKKRIVDLVYTSATKAAPVHIHGV
ncbi:hypothetical protein E1B28_005465 [Marasmius oreades]|uniref:Uncharacterized protein n=1 Tax=Marasmius oreades TaxID=181124 RepID=A0A9P7S4L0_9AGAR|nr:uncharacterized protein E1B28_005465 [Marasmius oreades]KAG7094641.1 hypothetical protein E1B28_005465 [Marasmius oreades]